MYKAILVEGVGVLCWTFDFMRMVGVIHFLFSISNLQFVINGFKHNVNNAYWNVSWTWCLYMQSETKLKL